MFLPDCVPKPASKKWKLVRFGMSHFILIVNIIPIWLMLNTYMPSLINISITFSGFLDLCNLPGIPNPDSYFYCPNECGRKYKWKRDMTRHLKYECGGKKSFNCTICQKSFSHKNDLKKHMIIKHKTFIDDWLFTVNNNFSWSINI